MNKIAIATAAGCVLAAATAFAGPFDAFKGKMKEGMYEYKMEMEMPGMPQGMGKQSRTFQRCLTQKEIDDGAVGRAPEKGKKDTCQIKNMNSSGNTATYTMECTDPKMKADNKVTVTGDGYKMDMKVAMDHGGQVMNMTQHFEGRYIGPCK